MTFSTVLTSVTVASTVVVRPPPERGQKGVIRKGQRDWLRYITTAIEESCVQNPLQ